LTSQLNPLEARQHSGRYQIRLLALSMHRKGVYLLFGCRHSRPQVAFATPKGRGVSNLVHALQVDP
jgi:hypothetical protein